MKKIILGFACLSILAFSGCQHLTSPNYKYRNSNQNYDRQEQYNHYQQQYQHRYDPYNRYERNPYDRYERYDPYNQYQQQYDPYNRYDPYRLNQYDPYYMDSYRMLHAVNSERNRSGRYQLMPSAQLQRVAQDHAEFMARHSRLTHYGLNSSKPWDRVKQAGVYATKVGENNAIGTSEQDVVRQWMRHSDNRNNILGDFRSVGVGRAISQDGSVFWCIVFAR